MAARDGWREPRLVLLRTIAVAVALGLLVWVVALEPRISTDGDVDLGAMGYLTGFLLVMLAFEAGFRWPPLGRGG